MTGPGTTRRSPRTTSTAASTGTRAGTSLVDDLEARIAYLEDRLLALDVRRPSTEYGAWFAQIMPPEASRHFMTAGREQLLGLRALVDHWIGRLDPEKKPASRETIRIE